MADNQYIYKYTGGQKYSPIAMISLAPKNLTLGKFVRSSCTRKWGVSRVLLFGNETKTPVSSDKNVFLTEKWITFIQLTELVM